MKKLYLSIYLSLYFYLWIKVFVSENSTLSIIILLNMGQDGKQMKKESYLLGLLIFIYLFINILLLVKLDILSVFNNHVGYLFLS